MLVKVGVEEAYDRVQWCFMHEILVLASLPSFVTQVIMKCIITTFMWVLWTGNKTESFYGLWNPLVLPFSLYIFVLCVGRWPISLFKCLMEIDGII